LKLMLCYKLNTLPVHHCHTAMNLYENNGSCFVGDEFRSFLYANRVRLITSAPYHPSSNGLAERAVQILKKGLKKVHDGSINTRLAKFFSVID